MNGHVHFAFALSGPNAGKALEDDDAIAAALECPDLAWLHMKADDPASSEWIERHLGYLDWAVREALVAEETRPRAVPLDSGLMLILRGINTNPGAEPEDMVSLRLWVDPARIVSLSRRPLESVQDLAQAVASGHGPDRAGSFLCHLIERLDDRIEDALDALDQDTDALEKQVLKADEPHLRGPVIDARQRVVDFRRHISPQRDALATLAASRFPWMEKSDRRSAHEAHDRMVRKVEELDAMRDRLALVRDEMTSAQSERLNRKLYFLSIISAVFLPLGFLTGLMGINVAGLPGAQSPGSFWIFVGVLAAVVAVQIIVLRWLRLF